MKKRIGTLKGKPIVEGGGSNIIKENEININDIGSSSDSSDDDDISYFGFSSTLDNNVADAISKLFSSRKLVNFNNNPVIVDINSTQDGLSDFNSFYELGGNLNDKRIYGNGNWFNIKEIIEGFGLSTEIFKPISKEEFYRTNYTREEAAKIKEEYKNHYLQNAPSKP